jgi:hypothetical protein
MKRIVLALLGMSLVACSNSPQTQRILNGSQSTALSGAESVVTPGESGASGSSTGSGGGAPAAVSASSLPKSETAVQAAAATSEKTGSSNGGRSSLYWFAGSLAAIGGVILATDAITGGQAIGLFGEKKEATQEKKLEVVPAEPSRSQATEDECKSEASGSTASSSIQGAQEVVKFAENSQPRP